MPSYSSYKRQMSVLDDEDITWITVNGNHIPVKKGQSKGDAVKEFLESKKSDGAKKSEKTETKSEKPKEKSTKKSSVHWVDPKIWNDPRSDPWYALYN